MMAFVIMGTDGVLFQPPPHQLKFHALNSPQNIARQKVLDNTRRVCLYTISLFINPLSTSSFGPINQEERGFSTNNLDSAHHLLWESSCFSLVTWGCSGACDTLPISSAMIVILHGLLIIFPIASMSQNITATYQEIPTHPNIMV